MDSAWDRTLIDCPGLAWVLLMFAVANLVLTLAVTSALAANRGPATLLAAKFPRAAGVLPALADAIALPPVLVALVASMFNARKSLLVVMVVELSLWLCVCVGAAYLLATKVDTQDACEPHNSGEVFRKCLRSRETCTLQEGENFALLLGGAPLL